MTLKDCPFCGAAAIARARLACDGYMGEAPDYFVGCTECGATSKYVQTSDEAFKLWNRRADEEAAETVAACAAKLGW